MAYKPSGVPNLPLWAVLVFGKHMFYGERLALGVDWCVNDDRYGIAVYWDGFCRLWIPLWTTGWVIETFKASS